VMLMAFYLHLGPFARKTIAAIDVRLAELELEEASESGTLRQGGHVGQMSPGLHGDLLPLSASGPG